jgi:hypothetical protein
MEGPCAEQRTPSSVPPAAAEGIAGDRCPAASLLADIFLAFKHLHG